MYSKIAIFGVISGLLVAAIYSSSTAFAIKACFISQDNQLKFCTNTDTEKWTECTKAPDGKWDCVVMELVVGNSVPPGLQDAIDTAIQDSPNPIKGPKLGILDEPGALSDEESTENGDDTKVPKDLGGPNNGDGPTINPESE